MREVDGRPAVIGQHDKDSDDCFKEGVEGAGGELSVRAKVELSSVPVKLDLVGKELHAKERVSEDEQPKEDREDRDISESLSNGLETVLKLLPALGKLEDSQ